MRPTKSLCHSDADERQIYVRRYCACARKKKMRTECQKGSHRKCNKIGSTLFGIDPLVDMQLKRWENSGYIHVSVQVTMRIIGKSLAIADKRDARGQISSCWIGGILVRLRSVCYCGSSFEI